MIKPDRSDHTASTIGYVFRVSLVTLVIGPGLVFWFGQFRGLFSILLFFPFYGRTVMGAIVFGCWVYLLFYVGVKFLNKFEWPVVVKRMVSTGWAVSLVAGIFRLLANNGMTEAGMSIAQVECCYIAPLVVSVWFFGWPGNEKEV